MEPSTSSSRRGRPTPCSRSWPGARTATPSRCPGSASRRCCARSTSARASSRLQPERPDRASWRGASWTACSARCPSASSCCSTRRSPTTPTRTDASALLDATRGCSSSALLEGLGPGRPALRLRARRARVRALLEHLEPELGINELAQAGALEALRSTGAARRQARRAVRTHARGSSRRSATRRTRCADARPTSCGSRATASTARSSPRASSARRSSSARRRAQRAGARVSVHLPQHADRLLRALEARPRRGVAPPPSRRSPAHGGRARAAASRRPRTGRRAPGEAPRS